MNSRILKSLTAIKAERDNTIDSHIIKFLTAVKDNVPEDKPENRGKIIEYTCPLCGGTAIVVRTKPNGNVYSACRDCKFSMYE